jgi:tryptophan halogenase
MPIDKVVIVGGGLAGWLTAAVLVRKLRCAVTLVETAPVDSSLGLLQPVVASLPSSQAQLAELGIDSLALLREAGGAVAFGRALTGWAGRSAKAFHGYGETGASLGPVAFQHLVWRRRRAGRTMNYPDHCLAALAAQAERVPLGDQGEASVQSTLGFALQLPSRPLAELMQAVAEAQGVSRRAARPAAVERAQAGHVSALVLDDGERLTGELFLDCSGTDRLLFRLLDEARVLDWTSGGVDASIEVETAVTSGVPRPYLQLSAVADGWALESSAASVVCRTRLLFDSRDGVPIRPGRLGDPWLCNCIALGGAAGLVDPVSSAGFHLLISSLARLLRLFPHSPHAGEAAAAFNRQTSEEMDNAQAFAVTHYKLNGRTGEQPWESLRRVPVADRLAYRIDTFAGTGRLALYDEEAHSAWDWLNTFDALQFEPERFDVLASAIPVAQIDAHASQIRRLMLGAVAGAPTHADFLRQLAPGGRN